MIGAEVLRQARALLGVPWRHLGRSETGLDCIGLVLLSASRSGLALPDPAPYPRRPTSHLMRREIEQHLVQVNLSTAQEGDLLVFNAGRWGSHVGLASVHPLYSQPAVVHAYLPEKGVREDLRGTYRPVSAFRWQEP